MFLFNKISHRKLVLLSGFVLCSFGSLLFTSGLLFDPSPISILSTMCLFVPFYLGGSLLFLEKEKIKLTATTITTSIALAVVALYTPGLTVLAAIPIGIIVLALGSNRSPRWLSHFSRNDYSYGVYVLSFPIQQTLVAIGASQMGLGLYMLLSLVLSCIFAWLSWHLVEFQALKLKRLVR